MKKLSPPMMFTALAASVGLVACESPPQKPAIASDLQQQPRPVPPEQQK